MKKRKRKAWLLRPNDGCFGHGSDVGINSEIICITRSQEGKNVHRFDLIFSRLRLGIGFVIVGLTFIALSESLRALSESKVDGFPPGSGPFR